MSYIIKNFCFAYLLLFGDCLIASSSPLIELKTQSRIAKGDRATFKAKILTPGIKKIRLRYRGATELEFKWVNFEERDRDDELWASIETDEVVGSVIYYYVVWQSDKGSVEAVYGSPLDPHKISLDRRVASPVLHQNSSYRRDRSPVLGVPDRFGDDQIAEQIQIFSAEDEIYQTDHSKKMGGESLSFRKLRIEQLGFIDLSAVLQNTAKVDFASNTLDSPYPIYQGYPARGRLKLRIDGLELFDDMNGQSDWNFNAFATKSASLQDEPNILMGESAGLFGVVDVVTLKRTGMSGSIGSGWPGQFDAALAAGGRIGLLDSYWTGRFLKNKNSLCASSVLSTELKWDQADSPLITGKFHFFTDIKNDPLPDRYIWNGGLFFDLPFNKKINSQLILTAGQTLTEYRLFKASVRLNNNFHIDAWNYLHFGVGSGFVGLLESGSCAVLGITLKGVSACRLTGTASIRHRVRLAYWAALRNGFELAASNDEPLSKESLLHPSFLLEMTPNRNLMLKVGFSKSLRRPTLQEKRNVLQANTDEILMSEKLRLFFLSARLSLPTDYAMISFDIQGRTGWLNDGIGEQLDSAGNKKWKNLDEERVSGLNLNLNAELADANLIYMGAEIHSGVRTLPGSKVVMGARLNLRKMGSMHLEVQTISKTLGEDGLTTRINIYYQTRPFMDHVIFEGRALNVLSSRNDRNQEAPLSVFINLKTFL